MTASKTTDRFLCSICKQNTIHHIIRSFQRTEEIHDPGDYAYPARTDLVYCTYEITCCAGCETVCFREKWFDHFHQINEDGTPDESSRLYSTRGDRLTETSPSDNRPSRGLESKARDIIDRNILTDGDLNAFCLDMYPNVSNEFSGSMTRTDKVNLLLTKEKYNLERLIQILDKLGSPA